MEKAIATVMLTVAGITAIIAVINALMPAISRTNGSIVASADSVDAASHPIEIIHAAGTDGSPTVEAWAKNIGGIVDRAAQTASTSSSAPAKASCACPTADPDCVAPCWAYTLENDTVWNPDSHPADHPDAGLRPRGRHHLLHQDRRAQRHQRRTLLHGLTMENAIPSLIIGAIMLTAIAIMAPRQPADLRATRAAACAPWRPASANRPAPSSPSQNTAVDAVRRHSSPSTCATTARHASLRSTASTSSSPTTTAPRRQVSAWLPFNDSGPAANAWTLISILDDGFEPGILNPGETAQLRLDLTPGIAASQSNSLVISTELGSTVEAAFTS